MLTFYASWLFHLRNRNCHGVWLLYALRWARQTSLITSSTELWIWGSQWVWHAAQPLLRDTLPNLSLLGHGTSILLLPSLFKLSAFPFYKFLASPLFHHQDDGQMHCCPFFACSQSKCCYLDAWSSMSQRLCDFSVSFLPPTNWCLRLRFHVCWIIYGCSG